MDASVAAMIAWLESDPTTSIAPGLAVVEGADGLRGLGSSSPCAAGAELLRISLDQRCLALPPRSNLPAARDAQLRALIAALPALLARPEHAAVARSQLQLAAVALRLALDGSGVYRASVVGGGALMAAQWGDAAIEALQSAELAAILRERAAWVDAVYAALPWAAAEATGRRALAGDAADTGGNDGDGDCGGAGAGAGARAGTGGGGVAVRPSLEEWRWAYGIVRSRCHCAHTAPPPPAANGSAGADEAEAEGGGEGGEAPQSKLYWAEGDVMTMVPLLDMVNHSFAPNAERKYLEAEQCFVLEALTDVPVRLLLLLLLLLLLPLTRCLASAGGRALLLRLL